MASAPAEPVVVYDRCGGPPRFSADGAQLAFTAQYDGNTEVYVMPATGGTPKRLTMSRESVREMSAV